MIKLILIVIAVIVILNFRDGLGFTSFKAPEVEKIQPKKETVKKAEAKPKASTAKKTKKTAEKKPKPKSKAKSKEAKKETS